jgi:hypothetical protein
MHYMETLSQAMNRLRNEGFVSEFTREEFGQLDPLEWRIAEVCRFEGKSNPDDNSVLYAIVKSDGSRRGLIVNAYGTYADTEINDFVRKIPATYK